MNTDREKLLEPILSTFENNDIKKFAIVLLDNLPEYIWNVPVSSTGKYHPIYSLGQGGLMRHQIAVVRFLNFFFELEQYNKNISSRERDLMRISGLTHDSRKSGSQSDYERSKYTKFSHPILMANVIRSYDGQYLNHEEIEFICRCIESHMGQFNADKKTGELLPKPNDLYQELVHLADYLASRKSLTMDFEGYEQPKVEVPALEDYVINFGKHSGTKIVDLWKTHKDYLLWCKENVRREPLQSLIKELEKREQEEDLDI